MVDATPRTGTLSPAAQLLEREGELASLTALVEAAAGGEARVALIEGPPGIGKTQLVAACRRHADEAGLRVLGARGSELEREFPYGIIRQLFEPALVDPAARKRLLQGAAAVAAAVFDAAGDEAAGDASFAVLHGLYWLVVNLSGEQPLLLAVDDLHWADHPSLRFLAYLVRRLEGLPVLAVCSLRPNEPGLDAALYGEIASDPATQMLQPRPLSEDAVAELVAARLGEDADPAFSAACHEATGGNPLLLNELLKALVTEGVKPDAAGVGMVSEIGPRAASRAVLLRLARLSSDAVAVARALAVLGEEPDVRTLGALAGLGERETAAATAALVRAEILCPEPPVGFVHALVGAAVYHDIPPGERELAHERAAQLLAGAGAPEERVAGQLLAMPRRGEQWVVDTLSQAARVAAARGASESAVAYLRRALEESPTPERRGELLIQLGLAEALLDGAAASEHLLEGRRSLSDPGARGEIAAALVSALFFTGRVAEANALALETLAELGPEHEHLRRWVEANRLTIAHFDLGTVSIDDPQFARYRGELVGPDVGARSLAAASVYQWAMTGGSADECVALAIRALEDGTLIEGTHAGGPTMGAIIVLALADRPEAVEFCDQVLAWSHRHGSAFEASGAYLFRGLSRLLSGALVEAQEDVERAFELTTMWGSTAVTLYPAAYLADTLLERGDATGAKASLARASIRDTVPGSTNDAWWLASRLRQLVALGDHEAALEVADDVERRFRDVIVNPAWVPWRSLRAEALYALGRADEAIEQAKAEVRLARRWGAPRVLGRALRVLGTVAGPAGMPQLEEAVSVLDGSIARLEHAKALAALGAALRRARRPSDAREPLRQALELATQCDAAPLVEHVRAELAAAGARPRTTALRGVAALTASESRVASLAAEGQTNRDIAQVLFVTPKTVEVHLSSAYRKLGIGSRRELAAALAAT